MATAPVAPVAKENEFQKIEHAIVGDAKKVIAVIELVGRDADKGLTAIAPYLPEAANLAEVFFPAQQAQLTGVVNAVQLIQQAVVEIKAKYASLPAGLTTTQMVADELAFVGPTVTALLAKEGISADNAFIANLINGVVAILKARNVAA